MIRVAGGIPATKSSIADTQTVVVKKDRAVGVAATER